MTKINEEQAYFCEEWIVIKTIKCHLRTSHFFDVSERSEEEYVYDQISLKVVITFLPKNWCINAPHSAQDQSLIMFFQ